MDFYIKGKLFFAVKGDQTMATVRLTKKNTYELLKMFKAKYGDKKISVVMKLFLKDQEITGLGLVKK